MHWTLNAMSMRPVEATWSCPRFEYSRYSVFVCSFQSEIVNCRLFWQFSGLLGGGGGCEWVIQGRSMRGSCVRHSALRPDELAPIWTAAKVWLTPSFVVRGSSHPLTKPGFCELLALWMNPLALWLLLLFSFVHFFSACLFWRGMDLQACTVLAGTTSGSTNLYSCYWREKVHLTSAMIPHLDVYSNQRSRI